MVHLDGGACLNQRSLVVALDLFGQEHRPASTTDLRLSELIEALWVLDLMVAHTHVSVDGTLPDGDRATAKKAADDFSKTTGWTRDEVCEAIPQSQDLQLFMQVDAADRALGLLDGPVPGLDSSLSSDAAKVFFDELEQAITVVDQTRSSDLAQEQLLKIADRRFRGSKCVAGLAGLGAEEATKALNLRNQYQADQGLAASMLINRFRFGYLRHLARSAGDVYVPGSAWRKFSAGNARSTYSALARHLDKSRLSEAQRALGGRDHELEGVLPPIGLYCLMSSNPRHGPRAVVDAARAVAADYRKVLGHLTKASNDVLAAYQGWTQMTGVEDLDRLNETIEQVLTDKLGKVNRKVAKLRQRNPSAIGRFLTSMTGLPGQGVAAVVSEGTKEAIVKGAALSAGVTAAGLSVAGGLGVLVGGVVGAAAGVVVDQVGKGVYRNLRSYLIGHVDSYRALDGYLSHRDVAVVHMPRLEEMTLHVLGRRLIR